MMKKRIVNLVLALAFAGGLAIAEGTRHYWVTWLVGAPVMFGAVIGLIKNNEEWHGIKI